MQQLLTLTGHIAAIVGILICFASGMARIAGHYHLAGYESTTLFTVGIGLMVFACLVKLETLTANSRQ
jgi:type IV secretory pathway VirB2 component (pilin)